MAQAANCQKGAGATSTGKKDRVQPMNEVREHVSKQSNLTIINT